jgi:transposase
MPSTSLVLTTDQRADLEARVRSGRGRADAARRARVILLLAEGCSYAAIATMTGCSSRTIALWKHRFAKDGLAGLAARHRGSKPTVLTPALEARIMTWTRRPPPMAPRTGPRGRSAASWACNTRLSRAPAREALTQLEGQMASPDAPGPSSFRTGIRTTSFRSLCATPQDACGAVRPARGRA